MLKLFNLKVNNETTPIGIDDFTPEFSWNNSGDERQKSYRITVSQNADFSTPVWDSGEVLSCEHLHISYAGKNLESCKTYYWKVILNGGVSASSTFETAFLNPEKEFCARWIGQPLGFVGGADDIRLDFEAEKPVKRARFYVAMLGCGKVYFNGMLLDDCYFDGGISVYSKTIPYRTYKLDVKHGNNALCMRIGYGFYGAKKIYGLLRVEYEDGDFYEMPTISGRIWNMKKDAVTRSGVYDGETVDARLKDDWLNPDYKVTFDKWVAAFIADAPSGKLKSNKIPPMRIVARFPAVITKSNEKLYADAGVNICGFLSLKVKGERGATVTVTHAERLSLNGELDNANYRAAENKDEYILSGNGEEIFVPEFTYHGFRFACIETVGKVEIINAEVCVLRTDLPVVSKFSCSDKTLNRLHEMAVRTEGNNLNGVFTDCPQRDERLGWLNDLTSRLYQSVNNFALEKFLPNFTDMTSDAQNDNGVIPDTVPYEVGCDIADPVSAYTLGAWLAYVYYGDKKVIERNYENFEKWINFLKADADANGGTVAYGYYGDWCPAAIYANGTKSRFVGESFMSAIYFLWYLKHMRFFASLIGKMSDEKKYREEYLKYKKFFDNKYYDQKTGVYGSGSQAELAVSATIFDEDKEKCAYWISLADKDVKERGYHMTCGNQAYRHLIYRLAEYGYGDTVKKLLVNPEYPGWGFMLENGATTVWERWENKLGDDMHSFDHPMFSAYDGFFINYLAGIRSDLCKNCFEKIVIKPCFIDDIDFCKAKFTTLRGDIKVEWKKSEDKILLDVTYPFESSLTVIAEGFEITSDKIKTQNQISVSGGYNSFIIRRKSEK